MVNEELIAVNLKLEQYLFYLRNKTVFSAHRKNIFFSFKVRSFTSNKRRDINYPGNCST